MEENIHKCICIIEHINWNDKNSCIKLGEKLSYKKYKVKYNTKKKEYKIVRPNQMGLWSFTILNENVEMYTCGEDWFNQYFVDIINMREKKLNILL